MSKNNNNYGFLFGAAVGIAAGMWLNSKKGRAFRKDFTGNVETYAIKAKEELEKKIEESKDVIGNLTDKAQETLASYTDGAQEKLDTVENSFESGANRAKSEIDKFDV